MRSEPPPGLRHASSVMLLLLCVAGFGLAQNTNSGDIRGVVTDPTGSVIPGATVTILNIDTGVAKTLTTNQSGIYDAVSILPGNYKITFRKDGFNLLVRDGVTLQVGAPLSIDAQLTVGTASEQISVSTESTLLKTETGEQSTTLKAETMTQLPNPGQNWANFTKLIPGSSGAPSASQGVANPGTGISINGNLPYYANFLADGASTTLPHSANVDVSIFESVAEVQINTSSFSAQYGIGGAVFNQISKGGTNQWHGSAYEYFQNDALNARSFFDGSATPRLRYDNFGGSVGGPILKNKLFFYFNIDKIINPNSSTQRVTVPTDPMRNGDFSDPALPLIYDPRTLSGGVRSPFPGNQIPASRFDTVAAALQSYYPHANLSGFSNNYQYVRPNQNSFIKEFGRLDYNVTDNNRITFSITQRDNPTFNANTSCPINCQTGDVDSYNAQVSDVWTISSNTVNEFRYGFTRQGNWFTPQSLGLGYPQKIGLQYAKADIFPNITINGTGGNNVLNPQTNAIYIENSFEPSDVVTMIRGKHILHFGGELLAYQDNSTPWGNTQSGQFTFTGVFTQSSPNAPKTGLGYADFLLGQVQNWNVNNQPAAGGRQKSPQFFVQDDFKVLRNLTVNVGLRYQIQNGWSEVHNQMGTFDTSIVNPKTNTLGAVWFSPNNGRSSLEKPNYSIFLPRVGFAYSPRSNWVVRGGFGIYAYGWSLDTYGAGMGFGSNNTGSVTNTDNLTPVVLLSGSGSNLPYLSASRDPGAYNGQSVNYQPYHTAVARNYQWSLSVQRELGAGSVAEIAYVGSHGTNLSFPVDINQLPQGLLGQGQAARPYPQFQGLSGNTYNATSNYDSLQLSLRKRFSHGLSVDVNYTWSKFLDDQDSAGWGSRGGNQYYQSAYNTAANYSLSNFDVPNAFKGAITYQLPFGKGRAYLNSGGVVDAILGGWQTSTIFVTQSGTPYTLLVSGNNGSNSLAGNWYPNVVGNPSVANQSINLWFNPAAFASPAANTFGNAGRNILRGPRLTDFDFSLGKNFVMPKYERIVLQIRMDASNIFNHPSFNNPNNNIGNPAAGQITSTTVGGRNIQLGARLSF